MRQWPTISLALACRQPAAGEIGRKYRIPWLTSVTSPEIPVRPLIEALMMSPVATRSTGLEIAEIPDGDGSATALGRLIRSEARRAPRRRRARSATLWCVQQITADPR